GLLAHPPRAYARVHGGRQSLLEVLGGGGGLPAVQLGGGELEQHAPPFLGRRRLRERAPQACRRDSRSAAATRSSRGCAQRRNDGRIGDRLRLQKVDRDLVLGRSFRDQQVRRAAVRACTLAGLHVRVHGRTQDRMRKGERASRGQE